MRALGLVGVVLCVAIPAGPQNAFAVKLLAASGATWMLDASGALYQWNDSGAKRAGVAGNIVDMARSASGTLVVLRKGGGSAGGPLLERSADGRWRPYGDVRTLALDDFIGVSVLGERAAIFSRGAVLLVAHHGTTTRVPYRGVAVGQSLQPAVALTSDSSVYVGRNHGEFGGGLMRVDLRTGNIALLERRGSGGCGEGPLNSECDPVTAVLTDPTDSRCVIAAVGMAHLSQHGRILRVCRDSVSVVFERACNQRDGEPREIIAKCSLGIFGLASDSAGYWAVASTNVFRFRGNAVAEHYPMPYLHETSVRFSREIPGLLIVASDINRRESVNGGTPLVAVIRP